MSANILLDYSHLAEVDANAISEPILRSDQFKVEGAADISKARMVAACAAYLSGSTLFVSCLMVNLHQLFLCQN